MKHIINRKLKTFNRVTLSLISAIVITTQVYADGDKDHNSYSSHKNSQVEPVEMLVDFKIDGHFGGFTDTGVGFYTMDGPGYAPKKIFDNAEISDKVSDERQVAMLEGAQITFSGEPTDPIVNFTCLAGSCKMTFKDGSELVSNAGVELQGRAINMWGPVINSPNFDPVNGIIPVRILGCGGLKEVAGKGRLAGMVGSICFNGVLNFNQNDQTVLTGSSKCTIAMHTPMDPTMIP